MAVLWHAASVDETLARLETRAGGLRPDEVRARLARHGPNEFAAAPPVSVLSVLLAQLRSVIVYLLVAGVAISLLFRDHVEAAAIAAVLVINTLIGFVTELRARRAMHALINLDVPRASVVRDGRLQGVDARELVPGDITELESGRRVPADGRLISSSGLRIDEAPLTGESMPVEKTHGEVLTEDTLQADRLNMVYAGTTVVAGLGRAVVTETGAHTELGRLGQLVGSLAVERTPLERRLDALGRRLVWLTLGVAAIVGVLGAVHRLPIHDVIETAIALAVAAVPEALPAVATIALAVGMHRMARRRALVRRLPAVEALGSTTVICTDKTRTLTSGEMSVVRVWAAGADVSLPSGERPGPVPSLPLAAVTLLEAGALASRPQPSSAEGDPTIRVDPVDRAVLHAAAAAGIDRTALIGDRPAVGLLPFSSETKLMASFHRRDHRTVAYVKGAPVAVLDACTAMLTCDGVRDLAQADRRAIEAANERFAREGLRVLAFSSGDVADTSAPALHGLTFLGFTGLVDPPAPGVHDTIGRLKGAGLRTIMLTGDQRLTGEAVGRSLGMVDAEHLAMDGRDLDRLDAPAIREAAGTHAVFSRVTPEHKLVIVRALQARGEIVAMLGDGVNDAAALKQADVGVAMGIRGTDVAKQAASIVLQDDRFDTIAAAVEEGRVIFDNIRKFVFYLFSCNVAEIFVLLAAGLAGLPLPLLPLQLLWLNLVTDTFPALALAMEPGDPDVMRRPPRRPEDAILSAAFLRAILFYGGLITVSTFAAFAWALRAAPDRATTVAFMTLALSQILHLGNARSRRSVVRPRDVLSNPYALLGAGLSIGLQALAYEWPALARVLEVAPLDARAWLVVVGCAFVPAVAGQVIRELQRIRP
jgi:Ca2+-transporting ATPase